MKKQKKTLALQKAIQNFRNFIKNADHSNWVTLNLIIDDELSENEIEYIETLVHDFESFEVFNNAGEELILSTDQLNEMLSDLNIELDNLVNQVPITTINEYGKIVNVSIQDENLKVFEKITLDLTKMIQNKQSLFTIIGGNLQNNVIGYNIGKSGQIDHHFPV